MATVAEQLRAARESQQLTIQQVAEVIKIRTDHLQALEGGNFDVFTAPVFIKGFVRSYATLLKLEVPALMAQLDAELRKTEKYAEPPRLSTAPRGILDFITLQLSKVNWRVASVVLAGVAGVALLVLGVSLWRQQHNRDPLKNLPKGVYHPANRPGGDTLPLTNAPARQAH